MVFAATPAAAELLLPLHVEPSRSFVARNAFQLQVAVDTGTSMLAGPPALVNSLQEWLLQASLSCSSKRDSQVVRRLQERVAAHAGGQELALQDSLLHPHDVASAFIDSQGGLFQL